MWEEERSGNKESLNRAVTLESLPLLGSNLKLCRRIVGIDSGSG